MSYEIYFSITTDKGEEETDLAFEGLEDLEDIWEIDTIPGECAMGRFNRSANEALKAHSLLHPDVLFTVHCNDSEENYWIDYYRDGKHQVCPGKVVYTEFDEAKLV